MVSKCVSSLSFALCVILPVTGSLFAELPAVAPLSQMPSDGAKRLRLAPLNPDFTAWRDQRRTGRIDALAKGSEGPGAVPSPFDDRHLRHLGSPAIHIAGLPSQYDLRSYGWVTPVKDQGGCGACFAFATCSSLESWLLMNAGEEWDFSENHLKNYGGVDSASPCTKGGNALTSAAYLVRWAGPVAESDDPFHDSNDYPSPGGPRGKDVKSVLWFYDPQDIKSAVMKYGALYAPMYLDPAGEASPRYDASTNTYYHTGTEALSHGVAVIGWDDSKYVPGAATKGAWLVKNSWGSRLDYFYVSYENRQNLDGSGDIYQAAAFCDIAPASSYQRNYQYDELGFIGSVGGDSDTCWGANVFTAAENEHLTAVGFWAVMAGTAYEITVYDTIHRTGTTASFSDPLASAEGDAPYFGYYTVTLPSPVVLKASDDFAIVVKFTTPDYQSPLPIELPVEGYDYSSQASANPGESYFSVSGQFFTDITTQIEAGCGEANICIKGWTAGPGGGTPGLPDDLEAVADAQYASTDGLAVGSEGAQMRQAQAVEQLGLPLEVRTRRTGIEFRLIPAGTLLMGSPPSEESRNPLFLETQHQVLLPHAFYCGKFEVTQGQWLQVMGDNPSHFISSGQNAPVEGVSWDDCQEFLKKLCQMEGVSEGTYRLLTAAEWEYACRAGTGTPFCYGESLDSSMANFDGNYPYGEGATGEFRGATIGVGSFPANGWGLYDMHGNAWEWCEDSYCWNPPGPVYVGTVCARVLRGGGWGSGGWGCRSAGFIANSSDIRGSGLGLRLARAMASYP